MYRNFFGFSERPFELTPDPKFLFLSRGHVEALASLTYGIRERRGLIVIVGEVGTGKTLLLFNDNSAIPSSVKGLLFSRGKE
jgi:general secretion pathway protein A